MTVLIIVLALVNIVVWTDNARAFIRWNRRRTR